VVAAINDLYCGELGLWLNWYLPSVKLVKKVRVGAKVRRVYDAPQTPWQRVLASGPRNAARITELKRLLSLDPFLLGRKIDEQLQRIYLLANRRLSPKAVAANPDFRTRKSPPPNQDQSKNGKRNGKNQKQALRNRGWRKRASNAGPLPPGPHFPGSRLHFKCLDSLAYGYIFKWLDASRPCRFLTRRCCK